jgi:thiol:disulfide interchange protein
MRILCILIALCSSSLAQKIESFASLIPEVTSISPGKPFTVALKLEHPEGWHSYYLNSGGIELPPEIKWKLPEGTTAGPIQWPAPEVKDAYDAKSFIYSGSPTFLVEITPPATLSPGSTFTLSANASWQICKKSCIDEDQKFTLKLPVSESPTIDETQIPLFQTARQAIPKNPDQQIEIKAYSSSKSTETIDLEVTGISDPPTDFIPNQAYLKALSDGGNLTPITGGYLITLKRARINAFEDPIPQGKTISGILIGKQTILLPEINLKSPPPEPISFLSFLPILGGMFLGGLILNLMPCVFPVIGLKIMGFVQQAGHNRRAIAQHGMTFTLGVLASFAVLSGILYAVRTAALNSGGDALAWGYQLQNPIVVVILLLLMFILGLNMFGLFEIGTSATSVGGNLQYKSGHTGSFFSGILATVVATPCSAPFLGAAIGATMALPALQFFSGFAAMATGLATPYLILSIFPALIEKLPRPGAWMESFKQGMSFLLFATAAYLLWVYSGLIGQEKLLSPLLGLSLIASAAWIYGRWFLPHRSNRSRISAIILTASFATAGIVLSLPPKTDELWQPWSQETVEKLHSQDTPVFIDFTAQWCVTCQVNKKVAYSKEVIALAKQKGIVFLKADKTKPNPAIEAKLTELGRSAIPVNVLHAPNQEPIITPEVLTPKILTELFSKLPDKK